MKRLLSLVFVALVMAGLLAACGGGDAADPTVAKATPGSSATPTDSAATPTDSAVAADDSGDPPKPVDGTDLCAYLKKLEPHLKAAGPVGASAQLAMGLAGWVAQHPDQQLRDSMHIDEVTKKSCADVRKRMLKDLNTKTFQEALG